MGLNGAKKTPGAGGRLGFGARADADGALRGFRPRRRARDSSGDGAEETLADYVLLREENARLKAAPASAGELRPGGRAARALSRPDAGDEGRADEAAGHLRAGHRPARLAARGVRQARALPMQSVRAKLAEIGAGPLRKARRMGGPAGAAQAHASRARARPASRPQDPRARDQGHVSLHDGRGHLVINLLVRRLTDFDWPGPAGSSPRAGRQPLYPLPLHARQLRPMRPGPRASRAGRRSDASSDAPRPACRRAWSAG